MLKNALNDILLRFGSSGAIIHKSILRKFLERSIGKSNESFKVPAKTYIIVVKNTLTIILLPFK